MSVLKELLERRDAHSAELAEIVGAPGEDRELTDEQESRSLELLKEIDEFDDRIKTEKRKAKRQASIAEARELVQSADGKADVQVADEPMVYGEGSPHSYFADLARCNSPQMFTPDAGERMARWSHQVEREVANDSKLGRQAHTQLREHFRTENGVEMRSKLEDVRSRGAVAQEQKLEQRALASGGGASATASGGGAAFVTPVFYVSDYAPYREFGRAFADQVNKQPLPEYGMNIYMPAVTGPAAVAAQTEGSGVTETDPSVGYLSAGLITEAGQVTLSQQLLDRAGPNFAFDRLIFDQLQRDYAPKVDTYVLTQALANAAGKGFNWTGNAGAFVLTVASGAGGFYGQVAKAKATMRKTAGTVMNPTCLFLDPARAEFIQASSDSQGRPLVVPDYAGPVNAAEAGSATGDIGVEGFTGYRFNGLRVFTDANIPAPATGADQAIVAAPDQVYFYEGAQTTRVLPQTLGQNLQVILQLYSYIAVLVRYQSSVATILGTGMGAISYTN